MDRETNRPKGLTLKGLPISPGIGIAPVFRLKQLPFAVSGRQIAAEVIPAELERLASAYRVVQPELVQMDQRTPSLGLEGLAADPIYHGSIMDRIQARWCAEDAVVQTTFDLIAIYGEMQDPLRSQRAEFYEDIGRRLFRRLQGFATPVPDPDAPVVLVADEMTAFDASRLQPRCVAGVVTERGGATSHFAIVAKQLGIPVVSGIADVLNHFNEGDQCICDGTNGQVAVSPSPEALLAARQEQARQMQRKASLAELLCVRTATRDGKSVNLWGNIIGPSDVRSVFDAGGSGIGMFRTEFIYTGDEAPSEERQAYVYADILRRAPGPVVMRTLEAGGDKTIPYLAMGAEENPNLGWQGLRMCLDMEELFLTQLRAMLRASKEGQLWIMFPMVSALWELEACRRLLLRAEAELKAKGVSIGEYRVGIMIEVPSAALLARDYLKGFDFCSIGTNDLTQFTLAADRMNPKVARWYDPFHPAVLRLTAMVAAASHKARKPIGMAGDMASNPVAIPFLVGIGLDFLSATAQRIPEVKQLILSMDSRWAGQVAHEVLAMTDGRQIRERLEARRQELAKAEEARPVGARCN